MTLKEVRDVVALLDGKDVNIVRESIVYIVEDLPLEDDNGTNYRVVVL